MKRIQRWTAAFVCLAVLIASQSAPVDAHSYDASKIDPALLRDVLAAPGEKFEVIVRAPADLRGELAGRSSAKQRVDRVAKAVKSKGGTTHYALAIIGGGVATLTGSRLLELTRDGDVDYVFNNTPVRAKWDAQQAAGSATTPGIKAIGAPQAWTQYGVCGRGVAVAVIDSGVYAHADLAGRITAAVNFVGTTTGAPTTWTGGDPGGHGTHVAGLIAGDGTRSAGAYPGVAPCARIVDVRVIDENGSSNTGLILRAMQWILANRTTYNIKVANMSFGAVQTGSYKTDALATAAQVLTFSGVTTVVSAGNSGPTAETITSPATDPYVVTVGALDDNQSATLGDDLMAEFSSRGRTKYDRLSKPDVAAPGRKMVSLLSPGSTIANTYPERHVTAAGASSAEYLRLSGTSMSAPVVSGVVALMLERNSSLSPSQVKSRLKKTARALSFGTALDRGTGMVDAAAAVGSVDTSREYADGRVSDAFAKDMRRFVQGQPFPWRDLSYNGGTDSKGVTWENVTWENVTWDNTTWENITWESFTWENVTWENVTWENVTWESSGTLSMNAQSGANEEGFAGMVD